MWDTTHPHPHGSPTAWSREHSGHRRSAYPCNPPTCGPPAWTHSCSLFLNPHLQTGRASDERDVSPRWSTYIWNICMYICIYEHIYMWILCIWIFDSLNIHTHIYPYLHIHTDIYIHVHITQNLSYTQIHVFSLSFSRLSFSLTVFSFSRLSFSLTFSHFLWPKWPGEWGCNPCLIER